MVIDFIQQTLYRFLEAHVSTKLVKRVDWVLVPLNLDTTSSNALHILMYSLCAKLVGPALATQVDRRILADISELLVVLIPRKALHLNVWQGPKSLFGPTVFVILSMKRTPRTRGL